MPCITALFQTDSWENEFEVVNPFYWFVEKNSVHKSHLFQIRYSSGVSRGCRKSEREFVYSNQLSRLDFTETANSWVWMYKYELLSSLVFPLSAVDLWVLTGSKWVFMCVLTENKHADSSLPHSMQASRRPFSRSYESLKFCKKAMMGK